MEAVFEQSRPTLMDLSATVRKEETAMEPLLAADQPDEGKILAQIDRVAQARAELEKANARMLLGLRRVLTPDQWKTLQADARELRGHFPRFGPCKGLGRLGRAQTRDRITRACLRFGAHQPAGSPIGSFAPLVPRTQSHSVPIPHGSIYPAFRRRGTGNFLLCFR